MGSRTRRALSAPLRWRLRHNRYEFPWELWVARVTERTRPQRSSSHEANNPTPDSPEESPLILPPPRASRFTCGHNGDFAGAIDKGFQDRFLALQRLQHVLEAARAAQP